MTTLRSITRLGKISSRPLIADNLLEFHASRLLLLLDVVGVNGRIEGLTKFAKLDFFVRYPPFFNRLEGSDAEDPAPAYGADSPMIRYHYGPWDHRYYQILGYLEGTGAITVTPTRKGYTLKLTPTGKALGKALREKESFEELIAHMRRVKRKFGARTGSSLKRLIYDEFEAEVAEVDMQTVIRP